MKIYINNFNLFTWPLQMATVLKRQGHEVIFIDNASTYKPLLEFYANTDFEVIRLSENMGHTAPWLPGIIDSNDYYAVTDPDLDIKNIPRDWPQKCIEGIERYGVEKCGFSLDETLVPTTNPAYIEDEFYKYPKGNPVAWGNKLEHGFIGFPVDTTFAVYAPKVRKYSVSGIRTDRPYTARHLPWHLVLKATEPDAFQIEIDDEIYQYYKNARFGVTKHRMQVMIKEYEDLKK